MKGMNAMTGVLIMLLIAMTVFAWISTESGVGERQSAEIERTALISEADRRLEKAELYIYSMFGMSAQVGSANAANKSGRAGRNSEDRYWLCKGTVQAPSREEAAYAVSNYTHKAMEKRLSEIRGVRRNWVYDVGDISCIETGYNTPLDSSENDHFYSSGRIENIKTQDREGKTSREQNNFEFKKQINYNRYWYMYSTMKNWTNQESQEIESEISNELNQVASSYSQSQKTCVTNVSDGAESVCKGQDTTSFPPSGTYPDPYACRNVVNEAPDAVKRGIENKVNELEENYFDGQVSCSISFNEHSSGSTYPGIPVKLLNNKSTKPTGQSCANSVNHVEGEIYNCITSWKHKFDVTADFQVNCRDNKFRNVPGNSLENMNWKINMSLTSSGEGSNAPASCSQKGGSVPPSNLKDCNAASAVNQCENDLNLEEELE